MVDYTPFWRTMKEKNMSTYAIIQKHNISSNIINRIRKNEYLGLRKIEDLCTILDCEISDIVQFKKE